MSICPGLVENRSRPVPDTSGKEIQTDVAPGHRPGGDVQLNP